MATPNRAGKISLANRISIGLAAVARKYPGSAAHISGIQQTLAGALNVNPSIPGGGTAGIGPGGQLFTGSSAERAALMSAVTLPGEIRAETLHPGVLTRAQKQIVAFLIAKGWAPVDALRDVRAHSGREGHLLGHFHATGGRLGGRGLMDSIPVGGGGLAAPGELIVNRHTEGRVDQALGSPGALGEMVAGEHRPHWQYKTGGRLGTGISGALGIVQGRFPGLSVTSTTGGNHVAGSYHYLGQAVDLSGSPGLMDRAGAWIQAHMAGSLLEGIHNGTLSVKNGRVVPASFWGASTWAGHRNHIHLAAGNNVFGVGAPLGPPAGLAGRGSVYDPGGLMGLTGVGATSTLGAGAATATAARTSATTSVRGGSYTKGALRSLAASVGFPSSSLGMAAAIAMAESSGRAGATHMNTDGSIDRGLWQINSIHGGLSTLDPVQNARSAFSISGGGRNWNPWSTFKNGSYRKFLGRGGRVPFGGWYGKGGSGVYNTPTLIGVGDGGKERVTVTKGGGPHGGLVFHNEFHIYGGEPGQVQAEVEAALHSFADALENHPMVDEGV